LMKPDTGENMFFIARLVSAVLVGSLFVGVGCPLCAKSRHQITLSNHLVGAGTH
jgi:hypothetical protein